MIYAASFLIVVALVFAASVILILLGLSNVLTAIEASEEEGDGL